MIGVLLADDHTIMRAGLRQLLKLSGDIEVTAEATNADEVLRAVRERSFDVAVLDMAMPGRSGVELIGRVKAERPHLHVLVLSMHSAKHYAVRAIRAGASGYLSKESAAEELVAAIRRVAAGGMYITSETAALLAAEARGERPAAHGRLSNREFEVLRLLVGGRAPGQIAKELNLSVKTVSTHKSRILQKLGLETELELIRYALEHGLAGEPKP